MHTCLFFELAADKLFREAAHTVPVKFAVVDALSTPPVLGFRVSHRKQLISANVTAVTGHFYVLSFD
mgnify:CR=1 FL=1